MPDFPPEAVKAAARVLGNDCHGGPPDDNDMRLAADVLAAAMPALERSIRRRMAREILALDEADGTLERTGARNVGPYGDMRTSLRRLARGETLPRPEDLRGGGAGARS
ncbi:MAG TPA: hypothetical protein VFB06_11560 [Streptosporangiaceae bacterium]|nr:hypothetical protein [Streptosporangiaceae bacterium]